MEIAPGIHRVEAPLGERYISLYLFTGDDDLLLFDTGDDRAPYDSLAPYLTRLRADPASVRWIIVSHCDYDHFGGNRSARELCTNARLGCHALDVAMMEDVDLLISGRLNEFAVDHGIAESDDSLSTVRADTRTAPVEFQLRGGEQFRLAPDWQVQIEHVPGHSRGHLCILDPRSRSAVVSDAVLADTLRIRSGEPAFPPTYRYVDTYLASIARLSAWRPRMLLTAHFPVIEGGDVDDFLGLSSAFVDRLDAEVRRELAASRSAVAMRTLVQSIAPILGGWNDTAALALAQPIAGHLERLELYGMVERIVDGAAVSWRWKR